MLNQSVINKRIFFMEAAKITLACLLTTGIFILLRANKNTLLVLFNVAVMSSAAVFSPEKKSLLLVTEGIVVTSLSILIGGTVGYYYPVAADTLVVIYAALAFCVPKRTRQKNIFITGALMFLIFAAIPFNLSQALGYSPYILLLIVIFLLMYWLFDRYTYSNAEAPRVSINQEKLLSTISVSLAMLAAWLISYLLHKYTQLQHLYWIGLTVLVVLQGAKGSTIKTALIRIMVNIIGALFIIVLMTYFIPNIFWINFALLTVFLFAIFALGYSYVLRTLFIEMFVLSFTHLLGGYHNFIAVDRVILTLIGGALVIVCTAIAFRAKLLINQA